MGTLTPTNDRRKRAATAGLSAVGAGAGVAGLAYGVSDMKRAVRAGEKVPLRTKALIPLEVAGLGGEVMATRILHGDAKKQKSVGKALKPTYYFDPATAERQEGKRQRVKTEAQHQGARAVGLASTATGGAALGARMTTSRGAPAVARAARQAAITRGVPREHADLAHRKFHQVRTWAKPRRGRLLAGATAAAGVGAAAGAVARWKRDEATGISQDLGRSAAGERYRKYKDDVGKALPLALAVEGVNIGVRASQKMTPEHIRRAKQLGLIGSGGTAAAVGLHGASRIRETKRNHRLVRTEVTTSKQRGMREVAKAEQHLAKAARPVRDPGSELDIIAAASLLLNAEHEQSHLPWKRRRQIREQLQSAIARGYLNAPFTVGGPR